MKAHAAPVTRDCILRLRAPNLKRWGPAESAAICHSSRSAVTRPLASGACTLVTMRWSRQPSMCSRRVVRPPWPACADRDDHIAAHTSCGVCRPAHVALDLALSCQLGAARASGSATRAHSSQRPSIKGFPIRLGTTQWSSAVGVIVATWFAS